MSKHHKIGLVGLTAIGVSTMIGSGWLFSSYYAAKIAGPGAYISWFITAGIILVLGLCLAEISFNYPKGGLIARLLVISHNKEFAFICTIATWLGLTAVIATEAVASIQYLSEISPTISSLLFIPKSINATGVTIPEHLTSFGLGSSIFILLIYGLLNFWGIKLLSKSNVILTFLKILIPVLTAIIIIYTSFNLSNFTHTSCATSSVAYDGSSIFLAMIGAGMVYSFNGFQNITSFVNEAKNPRKNIPLAVILSVTITLLVYLSLQTSFIGALSANDLSQGWSNLSFSSPFVQITMALNLNLMTIVLYADAVISPSGTGIIYTGSTTRILTGMSENKQMPAFFKKISIKYNFSRRSLVFTLLLSIVFLLLFRSWSSLVSFLSLFYVISYMSIPVCLGKLRYHGIKGGFSIPYVDFILPLLFIFLSMLFIFSAFPNTGYVSLFIGLTFVVYLASRRTYLSTHEVIRIVQKAYPMFAHVFALAILSALSPTADYGGYGILNKTAFFSLIVIESLIVYLFVVFKYKSTPEKVMEAVED